MRKKFADAVLVKSRIFLIGAFLLLSLSFYILSSEYFTNIANSNNVKDFSTLFFGLLVEAFPFVVLGTSISVIVALFFKTEWIFRILPRGRFSSHYVVSLFGFLMPVCECGNVPVARRLILKGFSPSHAITFLLAAPILNPITFWSTFVAFRFDLAIVAIRMVAGIVIAVSAGIIISFMKNQKSILTTKFSDLCDHTQGHGESSGRIRNAQTIFGKEFVEVSKMLVIGSLIAAGTQVFIPRDIILAVGENIFLSVFAMILLSFVISICANVDAFFALSYTHIFTRGSIASFLIFGPMVDIKMLAMLRTTFTKNFLALLSAFVLIISATIGILINIIQ